jgi:hypothetical protein
LRVSLFVFILMLRLIDRGCHDTVKKSDLMYITTHLRATTDYIKNLNRVNSGAFMKRLFLFFVPAFLFCLMNCTEQQSSPTGRRTANRNSAKNVESYLELERKARELEALQAETEALQRSLLAKERMLMEKETELDSLQQALEEKEIVLQQRETAAKNIRRTGLWTLIIGIILIFAALRKMLHPKTSKSAAEPAKPKTASADEPNKTP